MLATYLVLFACFLPRCQQVSGATATVNGGAPGEATKCFDEQMIDYINKRNIPAASVAVLRAGKLVYTRAYGTRDAPGVGEDLNRPALPETPFRIASISKMITSLAVLRMAQENLLSLDDQIFAQDGVLGKSVAKHEHSRVEQHSIDPRMIKITIRQLLTHSAGFDGDSFDPFFVPRIVEQTLNIPGPAACSDYVTFMLERPLDYDPGSKVVYSNFGYCILGRVIEVGLGMPYEDALRRLVLEPAKIDPGEMYVGKARLEEIPSDEAEYYQSDPSCAGPSVYPQDRNKTVPCAYGALITPEGSYALGAWVATATGLAKLMKATFPPHCNNDCILDEKWLEKLTAKPSLYQSDADIWYALGIWVGEDTRFSDKKYESYLDYVWAHPGGIPGTAAIMLRMPDNGEDSMAYALVFNSDNITVPPGLEMEPYLFVDEMASCVDDWPGSQIVSYSGFVGRVQCWAFSWMSVFITSLLLASPSDLY